MAHRNVYFLDVIRVSSDAPLTAAICRSKRRAFELMREYSLRYPGVVCRFRVSDARGSIPFRDSLYGAKNGRLIHGLTEGRGVA